MLPNIGDHIKYALSTPARVGKSYFGVIVFGVALFVVMMVLNYSLSYIWQYFGIDDIVNEAGFTGIVRLYLLPFNLLYGIYNKFWIALILIAVLLVEQYKYVLPGDIMRKGVTVFGQVLFYSFLFSLAEDVFTSALSLIDFEWQGVLYRFVFWPLVTVFFTIGLFYIVSSGKTIKEAVTGSWELIKTGDRVALFIIYIFFIISRWLPNLITRSVANIYFRNNYAPSPGDTMGFTQYSVIYSAQLLGGIIEAILSTIFVGAILYLMRMDKRGI